MDKEAVKQIVLQKLPHEAVSKFTRIHFAIIDEGIEALLSGKTTYNGAMPITDDEWYIGVSMHFITAVAAFEGMLKGARNAYPQDPVNVTVNYRGESFTYDFKPIGVVQDLE